MKKPNWFAEDIWDNLCKHLGPKPFKVKSLIAKANKPSDCQGFRVSLYTAGSISISQHKEILVTFLCFALLRI